MEDTSVVVERVTRENKFLVEHRRWNETVEPEIVCLPEGHVKANESL